MLTTQYENFVMKKGETIFEMNTRFAVITNELKGLWEPIPIYKQVCKVFKVLPKTWKKQGGCNHRSEGSDDSSYDEFIGNLQTYDLNKK